MVVDVDVLSIINVLRILGESPEHHGLPWAVVAPVGLHQEVLSDLVEALGATSSFSSSSDSQVSYQASSLSDLVIVLVCSLTACVS